MNRRPVTIGVATEEGKVSLDLSPMPFLEKKVLLLPEQAKILAEQILDVLQSI